MSSPVTSLSKDPALLCIRGLEKRYARREGWRMREVLALHNLDLEMRRGSILAILGDSGAGKTTLARCIAGMERANAGSLLFDGHDLTRLPSRKLRRVKPDIQLIFQDPSTALNPDFTAEELIMEPLLIQGRGARESNRESVARLMGEVGLSPDWRRRRPSQFSGGQLQRIAIARALAIEPRLLILDEAFTGLDLSTAAQIANLLLDLRSTRDLAYILISHDIALAAQFADELVVMASGTIVERGTGAHVLQSPQHDATRALLGAAAAMGQGLGMTAGSST
jgi:ABC-type glutathione transport system ATPase component